MAEVLSSAWECQPRLSRSAITFGATRVLRVCPKESVRRCQAGAWLWDAQQRLGWTGDAALGSQSGEGLAGRRCGQPLVRIGLAYSFQGRPTLERGTSAGNLRNYQRRGSRLRAESSMRQFAPGPRSTGGARPGLTLTVPGLPIPRFRAGSMAVTSVWCTQSSRRPGDGASAIFENLGAEVRSMMELGARSHNCPWRTGCRVGARPTRSLGQRTADRSSMSPQILSQRPHLRASAIRLYEGSGAVKWSPANLTVALASPVATANPALPPLSPSRLSCRSQSESMARGNLQPGEKVHITLLGTPEPKPLLTSKASPPSALSGRSRWALRG